MRKMAQLTITTGFMYLISLCIQSEQVVLAQTGALSSNSGAYFPDFEVYHTELEVFSLDSRPYYLNFRVPGRIQGPRYAGKRLVWYHEHPNRRDWT